MRYSAYAPYCNVDGMPPDVLTAYFDHLRTLRYPPRYVTVFTAATYNDAPALLRRHKRELPQTTIVWRGYDGRDPWGAFPAGEPDAWNDGNMWEMFARRNIAPDLAAEIWFNWRVKPHLELIRELDLIVMLSNEAAPIPSAAYEAAAIRRAGRENVRVAAFCWATGTPANWTDYTHQDILDMVDAAAQYNALVRPHEYLHPREELRAGLLGRYLRLIDQFKARGHKLPDVLIGEYGATVAELITLPGGAKSIALDAHKGWRKIDGLHDYAYAMLLAAASQAWYQKYAVSFNVFSWWNWGEDGSFGIWNAARFLQTVKELVDTNELTIEVDMPEIKYPNRPVQLLDQPGTRAVVTFGTNAAKRNLRFLPNTTPDAVDVGDVAPGDTVTVWDYVWKSNDGTGSRWLEYENGVKGYVWADGAVFTPVVVPPVEPPPPPPENPGDPPPVMPPAEPPPAEEIRDWQIVIPYRGTQTEVIMLQTGVNIILSLSYWCGKAFASLSLPSASVQEIK